MPVTDKDFENVDPGELRILIPKEGWYPAQYNGYKTVFYDGWGEKLIFQWNVFTSSDKSKSVPLKRYYNLERKGGGRFKIGPLHAFRKDWVAANGGKVPMDRSSLPIPIWTTSLFLVEVVTVRHDSKRLPLPASFHWSKIGRVIRPLEEGERWEG